MPQQTPEIDSPQPLKNKMRAMHDALQEFLESREKYTTDKGRQEIDDLLKSFSASTDQFTFLTTDPKSGLVKTDESIAGMTDTFKHMHAALKKLESYGDLNEGLKEELKQMAGDLKEMLKHQNIFMHAQNPMNTPRERLDEETRTLFDSVDQMYASMNKLYQQSAKLAGVDIKEEETAKQTQRSEREVRGDTNEAIILQQAPKTQKEYWQKRTAKDLENGLITQRQADDILAKARADDARAEAEKYPNGRGLGAGGMMDFSQASTANPTNVPADVTPKFDLNVQKKLQEKKLFDNLVSEIKTDKMDKNEAIKIISDTLGINEKQAQEKLEANMDARGAVPANANAANANAANNNATGTEAAAGLALNLPKEIVQGITNIAEETEKHIQRVMVNTLVNAGLSPERAQAEYNSLKDNFSGLSAAVGEGAARAASGQILAQNQAVQQQIQLKDHQETLDKKNGIDKNESKHASLASALGGALAEVAGIGAKLNGLAITAGLSSLGYEQSAQLSANAPSGKPNIPSQEVPMIPPR